MYQWLVTVRATPDSTEAVGSILHERLLPLLAAEPDRRNPRVAVCGNCAGEFTYLAEWRTRDAAERFERSAGYRAVLAGLEPHLRVPAKRERWEIVAALPGGAGPVQG